MKKGIRAFTLMELLVVVSIVGILASALFVNFSQSSATARDAQRKSDLRALQNAIELYKQKYKRYPAGCKGPTINAATVWSGEGDYACSSGNQYIVGLAPEFIPALPFDPKLNGANSGYVYAVNTEGSVYKIMALNTVETENVTDSHEFFRCDSSWPLGMLNLSNTAEPTDPGVCVRSPDSSSGNCGNTVTAYNECSTPSHYAKSYALSGGFSGDSRGNTSCPDRGRSYDTDIVRCR